MMVTKSGRKLIQGRYGYANAHDMYRLLGVTHSTLPKDGMAERVIDGIRIYVAPIVEGWTDRRGWQGLRVMAICECGRHIAVGRMHQHKCK